MKCPRCEKVFRRGLGSHVKACPLTPEELFWMKVEKSAGCWLWTGALQRDGYAHFTAGGKTISSHRHAYTLLVGPIPEGMDLLHTCDVRHCVNPAHLRPGTHDDNMEDKRQRDRNGVKLNTEKARQIKALLGGKTNREISKLFGVSEGIISGIRVGRIWRYA